jgi:hypothetical protein
MNVEFKLIEVAGFIASTAGMRFPTKSKGDSRIELKAKFPYDTNLILGPKDAALASKLIKQGPVHSKFRRGITAWFHINMPRSIWAELDTYSVGVGNISSESTMYTLLKEVKEITKDMFVDYTPEYVINQFKWNIDSLVLQYGSRQEIPIEILKSCLPEGWLQARNRSFSYECLASIHRDRLNHRMPEWREVICPAIEQLPYFKELILGEV